MRTPPFTEVQRTTIRHHLGYSNVERAAAVALGIPVYLPNASVIELAMDEIRPEAVPRALRYVDRLDRTEDQLFDQQRFLTVEQVESIRMNSQRFKELLAAYARWQASLGTMLAVGPNPFDLRRWAARRLNVPMIHG